jgi:hypothetical protein
MAEDGAERYAEEQRPAGDPNKLACASSAASIAAFPKGDGRSDRRERETKWVFPDESKVQEV